MKSDYFELKIIESGISLVLPFQNEIILERSFTVAEFEKISKKNPELQIERTPEGKIIVMPPEKILSGHFKVIILAYLGKWWLKSGSSGITISPATGVKLPDGSIRCPDSDWISQEGIKEVTKKQLEETFHTLVPDFVAEVRSHSDSLTKLKNKMTDVWMKNGVRLAWLLDTKKQMAYIYRQGQDVEILEGFEGRILNGENVMTNFKFPLDDLIF